MTRVEHAARDAKRGPPSPVSESILRFDGVSAVYGPVVGVDDISLDLRSNEIVTLLGPSGCGKTTTLRMAIGLEKSVSGRITLQGQTVDCAPERIFVPPERRNMGMVFQSYAIWPHLSVFENIAYPLRVRKRPNDEIGARVTEILKLVGLTGYEDRHGGQLSGGQQQRVAVARGLVFNPAILLMDEPFSNLDVKLREQMRAEVKLLQRRLGITLLFVTHDQMEALAISDRIAVMNRGRIEAIGKPTELYARPTSPTVRDFLGRTIVLHGRIEGTQAGATMVRLNEGATMLVDHGGGFAGKPGDACTISLRPEQIGVENSDGSSASGENMLSVEIRTLLFLGDRLEANVALPSGAVTTVYLPTHLDWAEGHRITLTLPRAALQLWPDESGA